MNPRLRIETWGTRLHCATNGWALWLTHYRRFLALVLKNLQEYRFYIVRRVAVEEMFR